jgi:hypothetical protein
MGMGWDGMGWDLEDPPAKLFDTRIAPLSSIPMTSVLLRPLRYRVRRQHLVNQKGAEEKNPDID